MSSDGISPRVAVAIGLVALIPVAAYGLTRYPDGAIVSAINVVVLIGALFLAMRPLSPSDASPA